MRSAGIQSIRISRYYQVKDFQSILSFFLLDYSTLLCIPSYFFFSRSISLHLIITFVYSTDDYLPDHVHKLQFHRFDSAKERSLLLTTYSSSQPPPQPSLHYLAAVMIHRLLPPLLLLLHLNQSRPSSHPQSRIELRTLLLNTLVWCCWP